MGRTFNNIKMFSFVQKLKEQKSKINKISIREFVVPCEAGMFGESMFVLLELRRLSGMVS